MGAIDFRNSLNDEQFAAVTGPNGILFILAAAGTGKTRTLVYRVAYVIEKGIDPGRILLLTFTNRAAREMLERAERLAGTHIGDIWGGTFHHMANRILRRHADMVGYSHDYTILDGDDSRSIIGKCLTDLKFNKKEFPKREVLLSLLSSSVNTETPLADVVDRHFENSDLIVDAGDIMRVIQGYVDRKKELGAMDFDDLLVNCLRLFKENPSVKERYQERFQYILVDEYQDTNTIQAQMVDMLAEGNGNLFVVGDDFQCIYSWRGANYANILTFPKRYPQTKVYMLETNYRSTPEILQVANACIAGNPGQFPKVLRPTREKHKKPCVAYMRDGEEQARYVTGLIRRFRREGYKLSDIAILYRAHFHAMELQIELIHENLPYVVTSGIRFFEQAHIKDMCSILRIMEGSKDEMAFSRLIQLMPGVGVKRAAAIWQKMDSRFDIRDASTRKKLPGVLPADARSAWAKVDPLLSDYVEKQFEKKGGEFIRLFVDAFYAQHAANVYENHERRLEDIEELALYIDRCGSVQDFLDDVALITNVDSEFETPDQAENDTVRLSTVHQAKGLEWPVVIILWATEGMFPSARSMAESPAAESEERRLFYVAVTRAKDELCMCAPEVRRNRDGGIFYCTPSRFIEEIPDDLIVETRPGFI